MSTVARSVDRRLRFVGAKDPTFDEFWEGPWADAYATNGARAVEDASILGVPPVTLRVEGRQRTLVARADGLVALADDTAPNPVDLDASAFADWVGDRKSTLGLAIAGRVQGTADAMGAMASWDPVLRSLLDGRPVHRPGDVALRGTDGGPLDLGRKFRLGEDPEDVGTFLVEAGFVHFEHALSEDETATLDQELARAVSAATPDDGDSWWASTASGDEYPTRILNLATRSAVVREILTSPKIRQIADVLDDGHEPGDSFGEHFGGVSAEGLVKRVDSVSGIVSLPWHKDCERGGHSLYCCGLTVGVCLTPIDEDHGGLDVIPGSHRANIARTHVDRGVDLPTLPFRAARGDLTVHLSCTLHRSTPPTRTERRVIYMGFALPDRAGDRPRPVDRDALERERADISRGVHRRGVADGATSGGRR